MKKRKTIEKQISIPDGVKANIVEKGFTKHVSVEGPKGKVERTFRIPFDLKIEENKFIIKAERGTRKEKKLVNTLIAHLQNMLKGVTEGFTYKLQICFVHFPMQVQLDEANKQLIIKNFMGETKPRIAKLLDGVKVKIEKDLIIVESADKEKAGQTAANIEQATRITGRDRRKFLDGIWIIEKAGKRI